MSDNNFEMTPIIHLKEFEVEYISDPEKELCLIKEITKSLIDIGIAPSYKGFNYIIDSVRLMMRKGLAHAIITKDVYRPVAALYSTSPALVEHCIRTAIRSGWKKTKDSDILRTIYSGADECPTNYAFLSAFTMYVYNRISL